MIILIFARLQIIMNNLDSHIEALLFLKGEPMSAKELAKILNAKEKEVKETLDSLDKKLEYRGIKLIKKEDLYALTTSPESSEFAKTLIKEEFNPELSRAALEVLSIVAYKGPISRPQIDYIRGVNSVFTVRNLMVRGLIERIVNPADSRGFLYKPSFQLLQYLGIKNIENLPEYKNFNEKMENFIKDENKDNEENSDNSNNL